MKSKMKSKLQSIGSIAALVVLIFSVGAAQADGGNAAVNRSMHGRPVIAPRTVQTPATVAQPLLNPMGHNLATTIIRPAVDPVPFNPVFPSSPPPAAFVGSPVIVHTPGPVIVNPPPVVSHFPAAPMAGSQVPAISPSAPVFFAPPVQTITPGQNGGVIIIQRPGF